MDGSTQSHSTSLAGAAAAIAVSPTAQDIGDFPLATQPSLDAATQKTVSIARRHGAAVQTALERQMKVVEARIHKELGSWTAAASDQSAAALGSGPAAAQAALAAALEECVQRLTESEAQIVSLNRDVRQLRASANSPREESYRYQQRIDRLEAELRQLTFQFDAGDVELEQLKADTFTKQRFVDVMKAMQRSLQVQLRAELSTAIEKQLAAAVEPLASHLERLGQFAAHEEKAERDAAVARKDVERFEVDLEASNAVNYEPRAEIKTDVQVKHLYHELKSEFTNSIAELADSTELLKKDLSDLSDKVFHLPESGLDTIAQFIREEIRSMSEAATRQDLQDAKKLLVEVKDAGKIMKAGMQDMVTQQEFVDATEAWKRDLTAMALQMSEQFALVAPKESIMAALEGKCLVSRRELSDVVEVITSEMEILTKRVEKHDTVVSRNELAEVAKRIKQEVMASANKIVHEDLVTRRQELIDIAELMKSELKAFAERDTVSQHDLSVALGKLKEEVSQDFALPGENNDVKHGLSELTQHFQRLEASLHARDENAFGFSKLNQRLERFEVTEHTRQENLSELSQRVERIEARQPSNQQPAPLELMRDRESDLEQFVNEVKQRQDFEQKTIEAVLSRIGSICDRLSAVEAAGGSHGIISTPAGDVGAEDYALLMSDVKRKHEQESLVVEELLGRISSLCNRIEIVESNASTVAVTSADEQKGLAESLDRINNLSNRIEAVEKTVSAAEAQSTLLNGKNKSIEARLDQISDLDKRMEAVELSVSTAAIPKSAGEQESFSVMLERINKLYSRFEAVEKTVSAAEIQSTLLSGKNKRIESRLDQISNVREAVENIEARLGNRIEAVESNVSTAVVAAQKAEAKMDEAARRNTTMLNSIREEFDRAQSRQSGLGSSDLSIKLDAMSTEEYADVESPSRQSVAVTRSPTVFEFLGNL